MHTAHRSTKTDEVSQKKIGKNILQNSLAPTTKQLTADVVAATDRWVTNDNKISKIFSKNETPEGGICLRKKKQSSNVNKVNTECHQLPWWFHCCGKQKTRNSDVGVSGNISRKLYIWGQLKPSATQ